MKLFDTWKFHFSQPDGRITAVEFNPEYERMRKVVSRSNARVTGKWPSRKAGRMVQYDSVHERNAFKLLETSPEVRSYKEQPCMIDYEMNGEKHYHIPDILVDFGTRLELWEVKTAAQSKDPEVMQRTALMSRELPKFGYDYRVIIGEDLARKPRLANISYLLRHGRRPATLLQRERLYQVFRAAVGKLSLGMFQKGGQAADLRSTMCHLILIGILSIDIDQAWNAATIISWKGAAA